MENERSKIIMVDDNMTNLKMGRDILKPFYEVYPAPSGVKLFEILGNVKPDLILLDVDMPQMNGYDAMRKLQAEEKYKNIPVIFITARNDELSELTGLDLGASDYISKPFSAPILLKRIANQLLIVSQKKDLKDYTDNLQQKVLNKTIEVLNLQNAVLSTVADLIEYRDNITGSHNSRTQLFIKALIDRLINDGIYMDEISKWNINFFLSSAQLHDVGKIAISDHILNKPGKLTPEEFEIMKTHVNVGVNAIKKIMNNTNKHAFLKHALLVTHSHHEKWDGSGYPTGRRRKEIPLEGRLMAIADVYDALISERSYKKAFPHKEACEIIESASGTHFDPALINVFIKIKDQFKEIGKSEI